MTAAIATPINQIKLTPGSAMIISGLTWKTYEALLQDLGDNRPTRIAYNQGVLEIRMPGEPHEIVNRLLAKIIMSIYLAMEVPEIWLYRRHKLSIQLLQDGQYTDAVNSRAFPMVSVDQLNQWIELRKTETDLTVLREVQRFGREYIW